MSLSPDGRYVAFPHFATDDPHGTGPAEGFSVYDATTGEAHTVPLNAEYGLGTTWLTFPWSADSSAVYAEVWRNTSADGSSGRFEDVLKIDPRSGRASSVPGAKPGAVLFGDQLVRQAGAWLRQAGSGPEGNLVRVPQD